MTERKLTVSFGKDSLAVITSVRQSTWAEFAKWLTTEPPETDDKAARGWYCPVEFNPAYRDSSNFVGRHALTFDFDRIPVGTWEAVFAAWENLAFAMYTTWSHTPEKPRFRVVLPLSRPATYDEFQAVARKVATDIGIELFARESFTPSQMMFAPTKKTGGEFRAHLNEGDWLDVDAVLGEYADWTDHTTWPHRRDGDGVHKAGTTTAPDDKPGVVGDFCRAFRVPDVIARFELPYEPGSTEGRWTYTAGSRPDGMREYDEGLKAHSEHDTDPARGQTNAFDLVRLHRFGSLDSDADLGRPVAERPSYRAMCQLASVQPELRAAVAASDFEDLGPLPELQPDEKIENGPQGLARRICDVLNTPTTPDWLIEDTIEQRVIAILAGPRGSYKSFIALDWSMRIALDGHDVYVISGEGGDFDRRATAWLKEYGKDRDPATVPLYLIERRIDLSSHDGVESIRKDCVRLGIKPKLFVLDTFSKLSGGLEENDNTAVKQFIGQLDNGLKRSDTGFGATVLLVAHTGHGNSSRARGASALAADTDAEYIVSHNGGHPSVSVSRERFKSSPSLEPLCYQPKSVQIARKDKSGREITSLVLEAIDQPILHGVRKPRTAAQKQAMRMVERMTLNGESVARMDVVAGIAAELTPTEGKKDSRKRDATRALDQCIQNGWLFADGEDRVSKSAIPAMRDVDEELFK